MAWDPRFTVQLERVADRGDVLRQGRCIAEAGLLEHCTATTTDTAFALATLAALPPTPVSITLDLAEAFELPEPVLRDALASAELQILYSHRQPVEVCLARDAEGAAVTTVKCWGGLAPQFVALVRRAGMLAGEPTGDEIPVYGDAFPILATEALRDPDARYGFTATAGPEHAAALVATAPSGAVVTLSIPLGHEGALDRPGAPDLVVTWDDESNIHWLTIPTEFGDGTANDNYLVSVTLAWDPTPSLVVKTCIDSANLADMERWLASISSTTVAYFPYK